MITLEVGGKERTVRYGYNDICALEEKAGMGISNLLGTEQVGFNSIRLLLWAGVRHEARGLTLDIVGNWLGNYLTDGGDLANMSETLMKALDESGLLGKPKKGEGV